MFMNGEWGGFSKETVMTYLHAKSQRVLVGLKGTSKTAILLSSAVDIRAACWKVGSIVLTCL